MTNRRDPHRHPALASVTLAIIIGVGTAGCTIAPSKPDPRLTGAAFPATPATTSESTPAYDTTTVDAVGNDPFMQKLRNQEDKPNPDIEHQRYSRGARRPFDGGFRAEQPLPDTAVARRRLDAEQRRIDGRLETVERTLSDIDTRLRLEPAERRSEDLGDVARKTRLEQERQSLADRKQRLEAEQRRLDSRRRTESLQPASGRPAPSLGTSRFSIK